MFDEHRDVHVFLRTPSAQPNNWPHSAKDWAAVEAYMGLFELCERMMEKRLIDIGTFMNLFSYRVLHIKGNERIVKLKLSSEKEHWRDFLKLLDRIDKHKRRA